MKKILCEPVTLKKRLLRVNNLEDEGSTVVRNVRKISLIDTGLAQKTRISRNYFVIP